MFGMFLGLGFGKEWSGEGFLHRRRVGVSNKIKAERVREWMKKRFECSVEESRGGEGSRGARFARNIDSLNGLAVSCRSTCPVFRSIPK